MPSTANTELVILEQVLRRRYAGGEITREEYLNIRDDITREQNA